ncbi:variable surface family protein [Brachyspira murdochii]|uniref:variable surface family protein n=1 Tax=Brachyspira murdochii TaxID=84378 RepID=UPI0012F47F3F|nr:variable surface family protein [Brachyspira murdochii]
MKKILLTIGVIFIFNISSLFAYYHSGNFIDFLVHSNQVRIRTDALGVLAGPSNIRVAAGLTGANSLSDIIFDNRGNYDNVKAVNRFTPAALVGVGYDSDLFGIAAGYEFLYQSDAYMVHTPILHATALNDSFRISIPVSIGLGYKSTSMPKVDLRGTRVISTGIEARYYFPKEMPVLSHIRFFINYGNAYIPNVQDNKQYVEQSSFGIQARIHFKIETPEVLIEPILRIQYDQALATKNTLATTTPQNVFNDNFDITAKGFAGVYSTTGAGANGANGDPNLNNMQGGYVASIPENFYAEKPYRLAIAVPVGFTATSLDENIHFYLEPALSFTMINAKHIYESSFSKNERTTPFMSLGYVVYGEIYIRPVKSLEWYIEVQAGGTSRVAETMKNAWGTTQLVFNGSTGFHYYF